VRRRNRERKKKGKGGERHVASPNSWEQKLPKGSSLGPFFVLCFSLFCFFAFFLLVAVALLVFFFFLSDAGNEPGNPQAGQSLCAGTQSEAGRSCGAAYLLRTAQVVTSQAPV
jgi:hypothetical protein